MSDGVAHFIFVFILISISASTNFNKHEYSLENWLGSNIFILFYSISQRSTRQIIIADNKLTFYEQFLIRK